MIQIRLDKNSRICYTSKGMRAAEHLLLARFFDYQQISFHKTVQALELVLNEAVESLLRRERLDCSVQAIEEMIADGRWCAFDDAYVISAIREAASSPDIEDSEKDVFRSVLNRNPPKLIMGWERFGSGEAQKTRALIEKMINVHIDQWREDYGLRFWPWARSTSLTKIGQNVPLSEVPVGNAEDELYDKIQQAVLILPEGSGKPVTLQEDDRSLVSVLSDHALYAVRVYALLPPGDERLAEIRSRVRRDLGPVVE